MRIQKLFVQEYRVLRDFTLEIDEQEPTIDVDKTYKIDLIVGVNGTGKSTLMRLLAELFQRLERVNQEPTFLFSITYTLHQRPDLPQTITISNLNQDRQPLLKPGEELTQAAPYSIKIEDEQGEQRELVGRIERRYLPSSVVAFTSGSEDGWELNDQANNSPDRQLLLTKDTDEFEATLHELYRRELPDAPQPQRPKERNALYTEIGRFLFIKNRHLPLVILCGLLVDMHYGQERAILTDALQEVKIKALHGFSLKFSGNAPGDEDFIQQLANLATYTVQYGQERLMVFELFNEQEPAIPNKALIRQLITLRGPQALELFRRLDQMMQAPRPGQEAVLREINLFFERDYKTDKDEQAHDEATQETKDKPPFHLLDWFSDGEKSFLGRLSLFALLHNSEALVLLDEPEVHFNDYWKQQLVARLDRSLAGSYSHVVMTTHSSITLSDIYEANIHVLKRNGAFTDHVRPPNLHTLGADPSDIIMYVFEADSSTGAYGTEYIKKQLITIYTLNDRQERRRRLDRLAKNIGPGPWRYLIYREMARLEGERSQQTPQA